MSRPCVRRRWAAVILVAASPGLRAADDLVVDGPEAAEPAEIVRFAPVEAHGLGHAAGRITHYDLGGLFDQHVFRRPHGPGGIRLMAGRTNLAGAEAAGPGDTLGRLAHLRQVGQRRIAIIDRVCQLDARQRGMLELAVESDLRRLAADIDRLRMKYAGQRLPAGPGGIDRDRLQAVRDDAAACRSRIDRQWGAGSLLGSVVRGTLSPGQWSVFQGWVAGRRAVRWEALVRLTLWQLDDSVLGLAEDQHEAILDRLLVEAPPLEIFEDPPESTTSSATSGFGMLLVVGRLKRLDRAALQRLLDARQWAALERIMNQQGSPDEIDRLLLAQGVLEEEG